MPDVRHVYYTTILITTTQWGFYPQRAYGMIGKLVRTGRGPTAFYNGRSLEALNRIDGQSMSKSILGKTLGSKDCKSSSSLPTLSQQPRSQTTTAVRGMLRDSSMNAFVLLRYTVMTLRTLRTAIWPSVIALMRKISNGQRHMVRYSFLFPRSSSPSDSLQNHYVLLALLLTLIWLRTTMKVSKSSTAFSKKDPNFRK